MKAKRFLSMILGLYLIIGLFPVTARAAETYPLKVNQATVTSDNASDILNDGTVSYDSITNTLTLNGAQLNQITYTGGDPFTVSLAGDNTVTSVQSGTTPLIGSDVALTINGAGSLTVSGQNRNDYIECIYSPKDITVDGAGITLINSNNAGLCSDSNIYITNGAHIKGNTGRMIYDTAGNVSIRNSTVTMPVEGTTVSGFTAVWVKNLEIVQATVNIDAAGAVYASENIAIENSEVTVISRSKPANGDAGDPGLLSMGALTITDSTVNANSVNHIAIYANDNLTINGGNITAITTHATAAAIRCANGDLSINGPVVINTSTIGQNSYQAYGDIIIKSSAAADDKHYEVYTGTSDSPVKLSASPFLSNTDITNDINQSPYFKIEDQPHSDESKLTYNGTQHWEECPLCHEERGQKENHTGSDDGDCTTSINCSICGYEITGAKENHSFTDYKSNNDATCTTHGTKTAHCDNAGCEKTDTITDAGSALGHNFVNGTCTVCGESISGLQKYEVETGSDITWSKGMDTGINLLIPHEAGEILKVIINNKELSKNTDYTVTDEKVTINPVVLEALTDGEYTILLLGKTGYIETTVIIKKEAEPVETTKQSNQNTDAKSPQTGDMTGLNLWYVLLLASAVNIGVASIYEKRKKKNNP